VAFHSSTYPRRRAVAPHAPYLLSFIIAFSGGTVEARFSGEQDLSRVDFAGWLPGTMERVRQTPCDLAGGRVGRFSTGANATRRLYAVLLYRAPSFLQRLCLLLFSRLTW